MIYKLVFIDTETTGLTDDVNARLLQVAYTVGTKQVDEMYLPPVEIGAGAMAVHKITPQMVESKPEFRGSPEHKELVRLFKQKKNVFVAHNAAFDVEMIEREGVDIVSVLCTKRLAQTLMPLAEHAALANHKLQTLREYFGIELKDARAHDALGDVLVMVEVFKELYKIAKGKANAKAVTLGRVKYTKDEILERMIELSSGPVPPDSPMPFGKHAGTSLRDLVTNERSYCEWLLRNTDDSGGVNPTLRALLNRN